MADANYARYAGMSHEELYRALMAGDPNQLDQVAAGWRAMQQTVDALASALQADLAKLGNSWASDSGQEYGRRVGLISSYAGDLGTSFDGMNQALTLMSGVLREARAKAESPASADHNNTGKDAAAGAGIGTMVLGPVGTGLGAAIGGWMGHNQDEEEKEKARQRMVQLVAGLAGSYQDIGGTRVVGPPDPPVDLPSGGGGGAAAPAGGPGGRHASGVGALGSGTVGHGTAGTSAHGAPAPGLGTGDPQAGTAGSDPSTSESGTGLLGAGGPLIGATVLPLTALTTIMGAGGDPDALRAQGTPTGGAAGAPDELPNGFLGGRGGTGGTAGASGRPGLNPAAEEEGAGANAGANRSATLARNSTADRAAAAGRGQDDGDEPDERLTWLVEDDMVWGGNEPSAPPVLGGSPPAAG